MSFADRARLSVEITQSLRCGRAFLSETSTLPVLSDCVLVLVHPEHGGELRLPAQIVMANEHGTGLSLTTLNAQHLLELDGFADSAPPLMAAGDATRGSLPPPAAERASSPPAAVSTTVGVGVGAAGRYSSPPAARISSPPSAAAAAGSNARVSSPPSAAAAVGATTRISSPPSAAAAVGDARVSVPPAVGMGLGHRADDVAAAEAAAPVDADADDAALLRDCAESLDFPRADEEELEYAEPGQASVTGTELQSESRQERLRNLSPNEQLKVARRGELADRLAVERMYGKQVWEALLQNPRLTIPEVAKIARKGTVPKPLLDVILDNNAWIKADAVRRALLTNPKIGADAVTKLLRITPKHELKLIEKGTTYGAVVREAARRLLKQPG